MKDGVYINHFKDKANLLTIVNGSLIDGEAVDLIDYDFTLSIRGDTVIMGFRYLEYLGEL
jgi:hypothetical protein